jgi:signal transduction histidine kinase
MTRPVRRPMTRARTGRRADTLSSDAFAPEPTSSRLLDALSSHVRLFVAITLTFSVLGGLLQVVGSARGPLARTLGTAVTVHVAGNLVASAVAIALVVAVRQRTRRRPATWRHAPRRWGVSVPAATLGGALGGAARLPLELLVGSGITAREAAASVLTDAAWFLIAALATNTVARLARNERETRDALSEALQHQTVMRTQMLEADLQTRRDVAEWLHGRLQAELLLAADAVRRTGSAGEAAAERLARLRDEELRGLTRSLHPTLAEIDLTGALHELARRFADVTDVSVDVDEELVRSPLPRAVSVALYRACEEAVGNAVKHGSARQVAVRLRRDGSAAQVVLTVADDGGGADEGTGTGIAPGLGLAIIDTYVRTVGGTWDLGVTDGAGATLSVTVPLPDVSG